MADMPAFGPTYGGAVDHTLTGSLPVPRPRTEPEPTDVPTGFDHACVVPDLGQNVVPDLGQNLGQNLGPDVGPGLPPSWFSAAMQSDAATHLARGRLRGAVTLDVVTFTASCPACGRDAEWTEEREDTRLRARVACTCPG